ncbi:MAG: chromosome segregation protein SMC [Deltaproteobacteria bacterium]|nr:chromosome segregation protein SMC [Deltaproteobacteria bacterium]
MRIKSLELSGFKSFVDRTAIVFEPGVTAVVGPNGCGKSNVVDAIRWAMGEQSPRRLRGRGMEDVIFVGAEGRAPVGMAEVILTFDNSSGDGPAAFTAYSEIQVARRLYRTGESEYMLNKTPCRLKDIHDFFRDTGIGTKGYTIVEQGRIAEIVSAKPEERRTLIEEAAGIGKYKARRREAESKIKSTEQNLLRVNDVLGEIRRQISSIERQARKAERFKRMRESLRVLDLSLAADDRRALQAEIAAAQTELTTLSDEVTALETNASERELTIQEKRIELAECERVLSEGSEELLALRTEIKGLEGQIEFGRRERETLAETAATRRAELERLRQKLEEQTNERIAVRDELAAVENSVETDREAAATAETSAREAKQALEGIDRERNAANSALVEVLTQIARNEDRVASLDDRRAELDARMRSADEGLEVGQNEASLADRDQSDLEDGLRNLLGERDRLMTLVKASLESNEHAVATARAAADRLREERDVREMRRARLASLREVIERGEDVGAGTRHLLGLPAEEQRSFGIRGLVRDLLEVDREAEIAVEAVLAERAEAIVVDAPSGALSALDCLRNARAGHGVFIASAEPEPGGTGFTPLGRPLLDRVRARPGFEELAHSLLAGVNLVDDLAEVVAVYDHGRIPATFVTPGGDVLTPDGIVAGGLQAEGDAAGGLLARVREVRDLEQEVADLDARVAACEVAHANAEAALVAAADELDNLRNRHHTAALAVANHEKDLERTRERVKTLGEAHETRVTVRSEILGESEALGEERERLSRLLEVAGRGRGEQQRGLDALSLRIGSAGRELTRLETIATERRVEHAGRAEKCERLRRSSETLEAADRETREWIALREQEIANAEERRAALAEIIDESGLKLRSALEHEERARATNDGKRDAFESVSAAVAELEEVVRSLRGQIGTRREGVNKAELKVGEANLRLTHLDDSIREKWDVELTSWTPPTVVALPDGVTAKPIPSEFGESAEGDEQGSSEGEEVAPDAAREARVNAALAQLPLAERRQRHADMRRKLQALGDVNLGAIEEHEELSERFRFLSEQKVDLENTLESLRDAISRINRTSRKRFRETFEEVSKRFSENFPRLFRGGKASLSLTDSEDVLEAGIEILAMPPGKRLQIVNLLSGGEKTLTAIALLVAVFQVRPSPFFLLDEVDAALDDANVGRFNEIVVEMARDSQFVLITHNKRTIEVADILYGVTMERKGVSKVVSVELH